MLVLQGGNNKLGKVYACNVCEGKSLWTENHMHIMRPELGSKYEYCSEHCFIICSNYCLKNAEVLFIKWLSKIKGWTKKKAQENVKYAFEPDVTDEHEKAITTPKDNTMLKPKNLTENEIFHFIMPDPDNLA